MLSVASMMVSGNPPHWSLGTSERPSLPPPMSAKKANSTPKHRMDQPPSEESGSRVPQRDGDQHSHQRVDPIAEQVGAQPRQQPFGFHRGGTRRGGLKNPSLQIRG